MVNEINECSEYSVWKCERIRMNGVQSLSRNGWNKDKKKVRYLLRLFFYTFYYQKKKSSHYFGVAKVIVFCRKMFVGSTPAPDIPWLPTLPASLYCYIKKKLSLHVWKLNYYPQTEKRQFNSQSREFNIPVMHTFTFNNIRDVRYTCCWRGGANFWGVILHIRRTKNQFFW